MIDSEKKVITFIEFNTINEGIQTMLTFNYPCAFIVGNTKYDYLGNEIIFTDEYFTVPNSVMYTIIGYGGENVRCGTLYVENNFCKVNKLNIG